MAACNTPESFECVINNVHWKQYICGVNALREHDSRERRDRFIFVVMDNATINKGKHIIVQWIALNKGTWISGINPCISFTFADWEH